MGLSILWLGRTLPLPLRSGDRVYSARSIGAVARDGARVTQQSNAKLSGRNKITSAALSNEQTWCVA
jgi:hypothetical protein